MTLKYSYLIPPTPQFSKEERKDVTSFLPSIIFLPPSVYTLLHPKETAPRSQTLPKHIGFLSAITVA